MRLRYRRWLDRRRRRHVRWRPSPIAFASRPEPSRYPAQIYASTLTRRQAAWGRTRRLRLR